MSSIGLPVLNGFVGEFLILLGAFRAQPVVRGGRGERRGARRRLHALDVPARDLRAGRQPGEPQADRSRPAREGRAGGDRRSRSSGSASTPTRCCAASSPSGDRRCSRTCTRARAAAAPAPAPAAVALARARSAPMTPPRAQPRGARPGRGGRLRARCSCCSARCCSRAGRRFLGRPLTESCIGSAARAAVDRSRSALATYMAADIARSGSRAGRSTSATRCSSSTVLGASRSR